MKKNILLSSLLLLFALFLASCEKDCLKDSHIVMSKLVYEALRKDTSINEQQREALRKLSIDDSSRLALYLKHKGDTSKHSYLPEHGKPKIQMASAFPINVTLAAAAINGRVVEICPCPGGSGGCACPASRFDADIFFTTTSEVDTVKTVQPEQPAEGLTKEPITGVVDAGWEAYQLENTGDRKFTLIIEGNFADIGTRTYQIKMELRDGKLYKLE
ncbi:MAG TPA: hypothetical protein VGD40_19215 [Chryseosolibacter sp.]